MRVMVFAKATEDSKMDGPPTPEQLESFAAMDRFIEEQVKAGVFVAGAGLKNGAEAKRIVSIPPPHGHRRAVAEARELVAGFMIWEVKDMDEAMAWARRAPSPLPGKKGEMEIRPFYEAADLAEFVTPKESRRRVTGSAGSSASPDTVGEPIS